MSSAPCPFAAEAKCSQAAGVLTFVSGTVRKMVRLDLLYFVMSLLSDAVGRWLFRNYLGPPRFFNSNSDAPVVVTGIHWRNADASVLLVSYKHHGIQCVSARFCASDADVNQYNIQNLGRILTIRSDQRIKYFSIIVSTAAPSGSLPLYPSLFVEMMDLQRTKLSLSRLSLSGCCGGSWRRYT